LEPKEWSVDDEALLLGRQDSWPAGRYSTLAGFLEPGPASDRQR